MVYWGALVTGTHLPAKALEGIRTNDKILHFLGYAGLSFLLTLATLPGSRSLVRGAVMVLAALAGWAAVDEWTQRFVAGRNSDVGAWCADMIGSVAGMLCCGLAVFISRWLGSRIR